MGADEPWFTELYGALHPRVLSYALHRAPAEDAHDAVDEAFLIAWSQRDSLPDPPLPWLLITVRNTLANQRRRRQHQDVIAFEVGRLLDRVTNAGPEAEVVERVAVLSALTALTAPEREALMLVVWDGLATREAAQVAGCSTVTFAVRLHRARRRFADALAKVDARSRLDGDLTIDVHTATGRAGR